MKVVADFICFCVGTALASKKHVLEVS